MKFSQDWFERAACRGMAIDAGRSLFFNDSEHTECNEEKKELQKMCFRECQARLDCLDYALAWNIEDGIWGGLTQNDRKRYRRPKYLYNGLGEDVNTIADRM